MSERLTHTVVFRLIHPVGSREEQLFLQDGKRILQAISTVEHFVVQRQVSTKNPFTFSFAMEFADQTAYQIYHHHPDHVRFVEDRWQKEVAEFLEIDFQPL